MLKRQLAAINSLDADLDVLEEKLEAGAGEGEEDGEQGGEEGEAGAEVDDEIRNELAGVWREGLLMPSRRIAANLLQHMVRIACVNNRTCVGVSDLGRSDPHRLSGPPAARAETARLLAGVGKGGDGKAAAGGGGEVEGAAATGDAGGGEGAGGDDVAALQDELDAELAAMYKQLQVGAEETAAVLQRWAFSCDKTTMGVLSTTGGVAGY